MSQVLVIHPSHPQQRLIERACDCLREGGIVVYPTDTTYAIGCHMGDKNALDRIRQIRRLDDRHHFTIACRDLSEIALYARVDNPSFRLIKQLTPGPYTFLLPATRDAPKRLVHPKRRTIGLRVPDHPILQALLATLGEPIMTTTLQLPDEGLPESDPELIRDRIGRQVDLIIDGGACGLEPTTIIDLTAAPPVLVRAGLGPFP
ncbi:MAG TPA: threonylcarbamoyl-AMP synthase [Gammaproteobacteria bacterium]|jgi:tRNA threonylcarbamoyl adenosine modification protein (Sua5/YciO/YrdC/YwlC family)|nr:threonylcarbamoyl-AMP synthase [Gammaproteobacteria bacterium]